MRGASTKKKVLFERPKQRTNVHFQKMPSSRKLGGNVIAARDRSDRPAIDGNGIVGLNCVKQAQVEQRARPIHENGRSAAHTFSGDPGDFSLRCRRIDLSCLGARNTVVHTKIYGLRWRYIDRRFVVPKPRKKVSTMQDLKYMGACGKRDC